MWTLLTNIDEYQNVNAPHYISTSSKASQAYAIVLQTYKEE